MSVAQPTPARMWHVPRMTAILWGFARRTPWLPRVRPLYTDLYLMALITRRGWVRVLHDARGLAAFIARDGARIHALYVHPRAQRRGLARALLNDAKRDQHRLELHVVAKNHPARAFYIAQDFAEHASGHGLGNDENLADIHMVWHKGRSAEV